jgi:hypothetical protein
VTFERGDWIASTAAGIALPQLQGAYLEAVGWADEARGLLRTGNAGR